MNTMINGSSEISKPLIGILPISKMYLIYRNCLPLCFFFAFAKMLIKYMPNLA